MTDTELLDFLESQGTPGLLWVARPSTSGRGYRLHQLACDDWHYMATPTPRQALELAAKEVKR
jgi:hypothetical protein